MSPTLLIICMWQDRLIGGERECGSDGLCRVKVGPPLASHFASAKDENGIGHIIVRGCALCPKTPFGKLGLGTVSLQEDNNISANDIQYT